MNTIQILGRLGGDPDTKTFDSGDTKASFNLVTNHTSKGEKQATWFRVVAFGKTAEVVSKYLHKGNQVYVTGRMQQRTYVDKTGENKTIYEVIVDRVELLGSKQDNQDGDAVPDLEA